VAKLTNDNKLFYGDNLDILRRKIKDETVDLCYIDPPFNSKRNYNQIYNNVGTEDRAQAQAFTDTWIWDDYAIAGYAEILANDQGRFQAPLIELIKGLHAVLGEGSLLAYLISMALRITEIHRVLKGTGSFYLHCDPTASHFLKLICDGIFCGADGEFVNEIIWHYLTFQGQARRYFPKKHDTIFWYSKSHDFKFNVLYDTQFEETIDSKRWEKFFNKENQIIASHMPDHDTRFIRYLKKWKRVNGRDPEPEDVIYEARGQLVDTVWNMKGLDPKSKERLGYPTQKPEALLERIIRASSNEGDMILDAYCGCGTTVAVAQSLKRKWIGMDITYQSISLVLRRLEHKFGKQILNSISLDGIPRDMKSAVALAHKKDDRLRKEFEKWAVLTYTDNRAIINEKKGADAGIDGRAFFMTGKKDNAKIIFQVKSGGVKRGDIATLRGDMESDGAALAVLITLEEPTKPMIEDAKKAGVYKHETMGHSYDKISIVTVREIVEEGNRLEIPMSLEVVAAAKRQAEGDQIELL